MPTTVSQIFSKFEIPISYKLQWGKYFSDPKEGIYVVSTSDDPENHYGTTDKIFFDDSQVDKWVKKLPDFLIDGTSVTRERIRERLSGFWLNDESILYIGKAPKRQNGSGISKRVSEFYKTEIGEKGPHSGGQWLKVLRNINNLYVYCGYCTNTSVVERQMLELFMGNVSKSSLQKLFDPNKPLPFANIRCGGDKKHGLKNQRK